MRVVAAVSALSLIAFHARAQDLNRDSSKGDPPIDVILVAGQSNAVGFDAKPSELPEDRADKDILFWWRCGDPPPDRHDSTHGGRRWTHLQPQPVGAPKAKNTGTRQYGNFAQPDGGFGPEIGLGRRLRQFQPDRDIAIIKTAFSGTGIRRDWDPKDDAGDSGACFRAMVAESKTALAALAEATGKEPRIRAFVWVQGESDANTGDAPHYTAALTEMITAVRAELGAPELKALVAVNTRFGDGKNHFIPKIVEAHKAAAAKDPKCVYVDTARATVADKFHYDAKGTLDVGKWFAEALIALERD